jgi:hypothetical protein
VSEEFKLTQFWNIQMEWNEQKFLVNIRKADTEDLLDRITAYRGGMEAEAIEMIEQELHRRGVTAAQVAEHGERCTRECLFDAQGIALMCARCRKPAVTRERGWYKLFWLVPVFPRSIVLCKDHGAKPPSKRQ